MLYVSQIAPVSWLRMLVEDTQGGDAVMLGSMNEHIVMQCFRRHWTFHRVLSIVTINDKAIPTQTKLTDVLGEEAKVLCKHLIEKIARLHLQMAERAWPI